MKKAAVIIPNYNGLSWLEGCLKALDCQTTQDFTTIIVDNGSSDGSTEYVREHFPDVKIRELTNNTGFCHAVNVGIRCSRESYVLLLNNDTIPRPDFVENMLRAIEESDRIFSVSACMLSMYDDTLIDDAGDQYCALGWAFARGKDKPAADYMKKCRVFAACGGAAIYRRSILEQIGLFDEAHFAYLEDIDLGWRAGIYGYRNVYEPRAVVLHAGSGSSGSRYNDFKVSHTSRNSIWIVYKNMPLLQVILNLPFLTAGFAVKTAFFVRKGFGRKYLQGLMNGLLTCRKRKKVPFTWKHFPNYVRIQFALWGNMIRRLRA